MQQMDNLIAVCKQGAIDAEGNDVEGYTPPPELPIEQVGFTDFVDDGGKFVRRHYLMQAPDPDYCQTREAFSLVLAKRFLESEGHAYRSPLNEEGVYMGDGMMFGDTAIPVLWGNGSGFRDRNDRLQGYQTLLNFHTHNGSAEQFVQSISLQDVLDNAISAEDVRDRIVLIGYTDRADTNADYWDTPYGLMPGVYLHGQMVSQVINHVMGDRPLIWWWPLWGEYLWVLGWATVSGVVVWWFYRPKWLITAGVGTVIVLYGTCYSVLASQGGWLALVPAAIAMMLTAAAVAYFSYRVRVPR